MQDKYLYRLKSIRDGLDGIRGQAKDLQALVNELYDELKADESKLIEMTSEDDVETLQKQASELYQKI